MNTAAVLIQFFIFQRIPEQELEHLQGTNTEEGIFFHLRRFLQTSEGIAKIPKQEFICFFFLDCNGLRHRISFLLSTPARPRGSSMGV